MLLFHASGFEFMKVDTVLGHYGREAVIVFFVLSSFVIAYTVDQENCTLFEYAIHRISRIYLVVIPALILTPMADWIGARIGHFCDGS